MGENIIFEAIVGTYEQFVLGYQLLKCDKETKFNFSFANHSHQGTVKSVTTSNGKWLASSSSDETIRLYDMNVRKESGLLVEQNGTISCVCFTPDESYLISGSEDGSIALFKTGCWQLQKLWKNAHKGESVTHIAVHPSSKMALSLGKDKTLRTWNLIKGRQAYATNLSRSKFPLDIVVWSPNGNFYAIPMHMSVELFSVDSAGVCNVFTFKTRVTAVTFLNDNVLCIGDDNGELSGQSTTHKYDEVWRIKTGEKRVRGIASYKNYLIIGCSNGLLAAYNTVSFERPPTFVTSVETGCRITCLTIFKQEIRKTKQEKLENGKREVETIELNEKLKFNQDLVIGNNNESVGISKFKHDNGNISVKCIPRHQNWQVKPSKKIKR